MDGKKAGGAPASKKGQKLQPSAAAGGMGAAASNKTNPPAATTSIGGASSTRADMIIPAVPLVPASDPQVLASLLGLPPPPLSAQQQQQQQSSQAANNNSSSSTGPLGTTALAANSNNTTNSTNISSNNNNFSNNNAGSTINNNTLVDWRDRTLWASRQLLGGHSVNGFLRATATVQRIKRQRARQTNSTKAKQQQRAAAAAAAASGEAGPDQPPLAGAPGQQPTPTNGSTEPGQPPPSQDAASSKAAPVAATSANSTSSNNNNSKDTEDEEQLKREVMNPRTAKRLRMEMEAGMKYCQGLHNVICGVLWDMGAASGSSNLLQEMGQTMPPPLGSDGLGVHPALLTATMANMTNANHKQTSMHLPQQQQLLQMPNGSLPYASTTAMMPPPSAAMSSGAPVKGKKGGAKKGLKTQAQQQQLPPSLTGGMGLPPNLPSAMTAMTATTKKGKKNRSNSISSTGTPPKASSSSHSSNRAALLAKATAGNKRKSQQQQQTPNTPTSNAKTSTLRKDRKKKLPPSGEPPIVIREFDSSGKRICSKKDHINKIIEVQEYRPLRQGDAVAAKVSSRDLWILARVLRDHNNNTNNNLSPDDLLQLHPTKRAQLFREKVSIMDVEDNGGGGAQQQQVARNCILPLPRSHAEAAEWCATFYRKGSRCFAMYPDTTSLYSATVLDATTYCQENDDIVVVQFDEDEPDESGAIQKCHIPSRFVTPMPPAMISQVAAVNKKRNSMTNKGKGKGGGAKGKAAAAPPPPQPMVGADSFDLALNEADYGGMGAGDLDTFEGLDFDLGLT